MFTPEMIAPCGLDCSLCEQAGLPQNPCPGCRGDDARKRDFCSQRCGIIRCEHIRNLTTPFCDSCAHYPCEQIREREHRYATMYPLAESPMGNLKSIREDGMAAFLARQRALWSCPACGGTICVHTGKCGKCHRSYGT